MHNRNEFLT